MRWTSLRNVKGMYVATTELTTKLCWIHKTQIETHNRNNSLQRPGFKTKQCTSQNCCLAVAIRTLNWSTNGKIETDSIGANYDKILIDDFKNDCELL